MAFLEGEYMKIIEAINIVDNEKPNTYTQADKLKWLSEVEGRIKREIIDTHKDSEGIEFSGEYTDADINKELIVGSPYDDLYIRFMEAYIDYSNGEYTKYNNSMQMFNAKFSSFETYYNRHHMPLGKHFNFF